MGYSSGRKSSSLKTPPAHPGRIRWQYLSYKVPVLCRTAVGRESTYCTEAHARKLSAREMSVPSYGDCEGPRIMTLK